MCYNKGVMDQITNFAYLEVPLPNGYEARLLFRQFQPGGDWVCQASDETITDLQDLLAGESLSWRDTSAGVPQ